MKKTNKLSQTKQIKILSTDIIKNPAKQGRTAKNITPRESYITPHERFAILRYNVTNDNFTRLISELEKYPDSLTQLLSGNKKRSLKNLNSSKLVYINFDTEFYWAKNLLVRNADYLNSYVSLSNQFSKMLLESDFDNAAGILDEIEGKFGMSIWLIKNRIALLQISEGLEAQKKYTQNVNSEFKNGGLVPFVIYWTSVRNENQTSVTRFINQISSIINKISGKDLEGYQDYCRYHLLGADNFTPEQYIHILRLEYSRSIIDYYESFISLIRSMLLCEDELSRQKANHFLSSNKNTFSDERIKVLKELFFYDNGYAPTIKIEGGDILNEYLRGEFESVYKKTFELLKNDPTNLIYIFICSYSLALHRSKNNFIESLKNDDSKNLLESIINTLSKIIEKGVNYNTNEFNELNKIAINFSSFKWANLIDYIFIRESLIIVNSTKEFTNLILKIASINPIFVEGLNESNVSLSYFNLCNDIASSFKLTEYNIALRKNNLVETDNSISSDFYTLYQSIINFRLEQYNSTVSLTTKLTNTNNTYFKRKGIGLLSQSKFKLNELADCIKLVSEYYISDKQSYSYLPISDLLNVIKPATNEWNHLYKLIDLSILLDIGVKHINKEYASSRGFAYEDFLLKNGVSKPSELKTIIDRFELNKLIYYLRYICIESTMDTSTEFKNGSIEILEERLTICRLLMEIDPSNEDIYKAEIKELVRRQVILSRRQEVDQSRIHVDIPSIRDWAEKELFESYNRYVEYLKHGIGNIDGTTKVTKNLNNLSGMDIPENETLELLRMMISEITDAYLSPEFGLDRFISTRIRHGIIERHLRHPMQVHNLITKRESRNGPYLKNVFWLDKLTPHTRIGDINNAFAKFSEEYDQLIGKIADELLQVKKIEKPLGLFDFTITNENVSIIATQISINTSFADFLDIVLARLEDILIYNLAVIRQILNIEGKAKAKNILGKLTDNLTKFEGSITPELQSSINQARTDIQFEFDKIIEWFVPSSSGSSAPYIIEDAMMVAEAMIKETNPNFKINVKSDEESNNIYIHGRLPIFVDIFINVFENIVKRSGLDIPEAEVQIWTETEVKNLRVINFKVSNKINSGIDLSEIDIGLKRKKNLLDTGSYSQYLATEKNSGLFKIHKSVSDFKVIGQDIRPSMDFGIEDEGFYMKIGVPFLVL